jgi:sugar (pentulose or hexulose) kinase
MAQILADVLGFRVSVPEHTESAARGAAAPRPRGRGAAGKSTAARPTAG